MRRRVLVCSLAMLLVAGPARAQQAPGGQTPQEPKREPNVGGETLEFGTALAGFGVLIFPSNSTASHQPHGYLFDAAAAWNIQKHVGVEFDFAWALQRKETTSISGVTPATTIASPNMLFYTGNVVFNPLGHKRRLVPYAEVGAGATSVLAAEPDFGIPANSTHFTTSVGGGLRWFILRGFGFRGDYRFMPISGVPDSALAGVVAIRHVQRVYGAFLITF